MIKVGITTTIHFQNHIYNIQAWRESKYNYSNSELNELTHLCASCVNAANLVLRLAPYSEHKHMPWWWIYDKCHQIYIFHLKTIQSDNTIPDDQRYEWTVTGYMHSAVFPIAPHGSRRMELATCEIDHRYVTHIQVFMLISETDITLETNKKSMIIIIALWNIIICVKFKRI